MANYTTARVGGPADAMLIVHTAAELENAVRKLWELDAIFTIIGSGSNLLVSDFGVRGVVLVNRARTVRIDARSASPTVFAESGANLSGVARQVALRGFSGLEWAASIPGTVGGAVYGNAGAHGEDMLSSLLMADILHRQLGKQQWSTQQLHYDYRTSALKEHPGQAVVLSARLKLTSSTVAEVQAKMNEYNERRRKSQPPGASLGSIFKNPPGDFAGRLIEKAGLKGARIGGAQVSPIHANFIVNDQGATASDINRLIHKIQKTVLDRFGVQLELEIERIGEWPAEE